jgi:glycosyltransferase involved in cell wall biosynthesis
VIAIDAMAFLDTMVHGETALLAGVAQEIKISETVLGRDHGFDEPRHITLPFLRTADYRASVPDIAEHLLRLMRDPALRQSMGEAGRKRVVELFNYRNVAKRFVDLISARLDIH